MATDTRGRIQAVAMELFARQGLQRTSLRQIAEQLGITKPALYYHFDSRDELVRSLLQPLLDDSEALIDRLEQDADHDPGTVLAASFDLLYQHRQVINLLVRDLAALAELDIGKQLVEWRQRMISLVAGPDPSLKTRVRAVVAVGGLADCTVLFPDHPLAELRRAALEAATATLGAPAR